MSMDIDFDLCDFDNSLTSDDFAGVVYETDLTDLDADRMAF